MSGTCFMPTLSVKPCNRVIITVGRTSACIDTSEQSPPAECATMREKRLNYTVSYRGDPVKTISQRNRSPSRVRHMPVTGLQATA